MRTNFSLLLLASSVLSSALPQPDALAPDSSASDSSLDTLDKRAPLVSDPFHADISDLWKRKGGGGGGGRGGGGGTSGGGGGTGGRGGGGSTTGGRTTTGSGPPPSYGSAGRPVYGGGAAVPYTAGSPSTGRNIQPFLLGGALGAATIYGGLWLYGAYAYNYNAPWRFYNRTTAANETKPVQCLCEQNSECGCDENDDATYQAALIGDGTYANLNKSLITVAMVNSTSTILLNGTLPAGTTAAGGTDDPYDDAGGSLVRGMAANSGLLLVVATVFTAFFSV